MSIQMHAFFNLNGEYTSDCSIANVDTLFTNKANKVSVSCELDRIQN